MTVRVLLVAAAGGHLRRTWSSGPIPVDPISDRIPTVPEVEMTITAPKVVQTMCPMIELSSNISAVPTFSAPDAITI